MPFGQLGWWYASINGYVWFAGSQLCKWGKLRHSGPWCLNEILLLCGASSRTHAAPLWKRLQWLYVLSPVKFKPLALMFDVYYGRTGSVTQLCERHWDNSRLHSSANGNFVLRGTRMLVADKLRSQVHALTLELKRTHSQASFRNKLKTHIFRFTYQT